MRYTANPVDLLMLFFCLPWIFFPYTRSFRARSFGMKKHEKKQLEDVIGFSTFNLKKERTNVLDEGLMGI